MIFFFSSRRRHTRWTGDWSSDVCSSDLGRVVFDLWEANAAQLRDAGVKRVAIAGLCTLSGGADLWSYRGRGADGKIGRASCRERVSILMVDGLCKYKL